MIITRNKLITTADIEDRAVTRAKLEYPTEDVSFAYLNAIGKVQSPVVGNNIFIGGDILMTIDSFSDKAIEAHPIITSSRIVALMGRFADVSNNYYVAIDTSASTEDVTLNKAVDGTRTQIGSEAVDLGDNYYTILKLSCSGSSLEVYREDMTTPKISVTDTDLSSGTWGGLTMQNKLVYSYPEVIYLRAVSTSLPRPLAVLEVPVTGEGYEEDPIRPQLPQDLRDPKELGLNLNKPQINLKSVTWGAIDYKGGNTMLIAIYKHGADYLDPKRFEDVLAIAKNKWKVPSNVQEAEEIWKELKKANPDMIAGKHTVAYHLLGDENIEPCSVADFYHGNMIEDNKIKGVPEWELRRTLLRWKDRLEKARINSELKDNHLKKLNECLKR